MTKTKRRNYWVITKDNHADASAPIGTNANAVSLMGPRGCPTDTTPLTLRFRLLVDQDEGEKAEESPVIYEGYMLPWDQHDDNSDGFEPLDNFGAPNFGCAFLEYWKPGKGGGWTML